MRWVEYLSTHSDRHRDVKWTTQDIQISTFENRTHSSQWKPGSSLWNFDCVAKIDISLGFLLHNLKTDEYRYFSFCENNTLFEKSMLLCTDADLTNMQNKTNKQEILEICTQEGQNTNCLITNVTIFAALLKSVPMVTADSVIPEPLLENHQVNFFVSDSRKQIHNYNCFVLSNCGSFA